MQIIHATKLMTTEFMAVQLRVKIIQASVNNVSDHTRLLSTYQLAEYKYSARNVAGMHAFC